jgi:hypothetical protein
VPGRVRSCFGTTHLRVVLDIDDVDKTDILGVDLPDSEIEVESSL